MTFKYDPNFDYYELFEMCLEDGGLFVKLKGSPELGVDNFGLM